MESNDCFRVIVAGAAIIGIILTAIELWRLERGIRK